MKTMVTNKDTRRKIIRGESGEVSISPGETRRIELSKENISEISEDPDISVYIESRRVSD